MLPVAPRRQRMRQTPTLDIQPERDPLTTIAVSAAPVVLEGRYRLLIRALWQLRHSRRTRWGVGLGSAALMLLLAFLAVRHFATTSWPLSRGEPGLLVAAGLLLLLAQALKALGWARLFTNRERPSPLALVAGNGSAALIGVVLPGRFDDEAVTEAGGIALRYGNFYGAANDGLIEPVRKRQFPIAGDGGGVSSFIHLDDAAAATVLALEHDGPAIYNIVDDEPAPVREWLPVLATALGAKPPRHVPVWLARLFAGELGVVMGTEARGASNAKAKRELGWIPHHPSWRQGFAEVYGNLAAPETDAARVEGLRSAA